MLKQLIYKALFLKCRIVLLQMKCTFYKSIESLLRQVVAYCKPYCINLIQYKHCFYLYDLSSVSFYPLLLAFYLPMFHYLLISAPFYLPIASFVLISSSFVLISAPFYLPSASFYLSSASFHLSSAR